MIWECKQEFGKKNSLKKYSVCLEALFLTEAMRCKISIEQ